MPIDRNATLRKAEDLLRAGKLDGAIQEYARLVEDQPGDWALGNTLGDLYGRAGNPSMAMVQFTSVADRLFDLGILPKAQAIYKKALRIEPSDPRTLRRLAEIAARQGLKADARQYLKRLEEMGLSAELPAAADGPPPAVEAGASAFVPAPSITAPSEVSSEVAAEAMHFLQTDAVSAQVHGPASPPTLPLPAPPPAPAPETVAEADVEAEPEAEELFEIDLSDALSELPVAPAEVAVLPATVPGRPPEPTSELDTLFEGLRAQHAEGEEEPDPAVLYDLALHHVRQQHPDLAVAALQTAVRSPAFRFRAGAELGRLSLARGDTRHGIAWFECALEAPPTTLEARVAVLYELGTALESVGEQVRALAVLLELAADSPGYRDVSERIGRLKQALAEDTAG